MQSLLIEWGFTVEQASSHDVDSATKIIAAAKAYSTTRTPENKLKF